MNSLLRLLLILGLCVPGQMVRAADEPAAVSTYSCIGLYWKAAPGAPDKTCRVQYRERGVGAWSESLPLWLDETVHEELPERSFEYRGSLVGLKAGTAYEVRLSLEKAAQRRELEVATRSDVFRIARTVQLPARQEGTLTIDRGGSPEEGYVLYCPEAGSAGAVLEGADAAPCNIRVDAPYVILRGLTLRGARHHGVVLGAVHDVVIEDCDISGWGQNDTDGWGVNFHSAIFHENPRGAEPTLRRITIQGNRLHHPRSNSNSWMEARPAKRGSRHPIGPQGITFIRGHGEHVIRHNRIYSDFAHMFNDAMGEYENFGYKGFPGRDSDIHGNEVSHCWDDGIEIEGANMNVRCFGNVIDWTFDAIGCATTSLGPCYVFRNVYLHSKKGPGETAESDRGQCFLKLGGEPEDARHARGRIYVLHNTVLQPATPRLPGGAGAGRGLLLTSAKKVQVNLVSRNNILWLREAGATAVYDPQKSPLNDFDHDVFNGTVQAADGSEAHGLRAAPVLLPQAGAHSPWFRAPAEGSPGHDSAALLPGFNDAHSGRGPDAGAFEAGQDLPAFFPRCGRGPEAGPSASLPDRAGARHPDAVDLDAARVQRHADLVARDEADQEIGCIGADAGVVLSDARDRTRG